MNEIQIIQNQLATERTHFAEVANICATALAQGKLPSDGALAAACADYFAFAMTRLPGAPTSPTAGGTQTHWRDFLRSFNEQVTRHCASIEALRGELFRLQSGASRSGINADSIVMERERYARVKAAAP